MFSINKITASLISVSALLLLMSIVVATSAAETPFELYIQQPPGKTTSQCVVGGCSSQLCVDSTTGPIYSTCEWRDEYACYQGASCEHQSNGECGWTMTNDLRSCLGQSNSPMPPADEIPGASPFPIPEITCQQKPACLDEDPPCYIYIPPNGFH